MKAVILVLICIGSKNLSSQTGYPIPELQSPKPGIFINGNACLIGNTIWSCQPKTCDTIQIVQGDSIEFCTGQEIFLNTDTNYFMEWNFIGCDNYSGIIHDGYPNSTPLCYNPSWSTPGDHLVHIYYNGWLSAYSWSDCYAIGPSHWLIPVRVSSQPNAIDPITNACVPKIVRTIISPEDKIEFKTCNTLNEIQIYDNTGRIVFQTLLKNSETVVQPPNLKEGIYFYKIRYSESQLSNGVIIVQFTP